RRRHTRSKRDWSSDVCSSDLNTERRFQRLYKVMDPLGESKPDWQIIQEIANRMGAGWNYSHPGEIMDEAASLTPLFAGVSYDRLEGYDSLQWPVAEDGKIGRAHV